jgi:hypothetical protein
MVFITQRFSVPSLGKTLGAVSVPARFAGISEHKRASVSWRIPELKKPSASSSQIGYNPRMDTTPIIQFIDAEIARLEQAKAILNGQPRQKRGRPSSKGTPETAKPVRRRMSPEGRARIAAAQKARWAKARRG